MTTADSVDEHVAAWAEELDWLDPVHEAIVARMMILTKHLQNARARAFAAEQLSLASFKVLLALRRLGEPYCTSPSRLADLLTLSRGALSARLAPLEDDGLIARSVEATDRRRVHVRLTDAGMTALDAHGYAEGAAEAEVLDRLDRDDQKRLADLLRVLVIGVEGPVDPWAVPG
ncbi:MarR family transcriptional regulator [Nocardioidaceae bacterium SCSIO 66511]|nr:MarR family transcriptional regulator [Nocardioidaceae bacterium SCSIO 66511]